MKRFLFAGIIALLPLIANADGDAPHWQVLPDKSAIEWMAIYGGKPIKGNFPDFTADIAFDPAHPEKSKITAKVALAKVKSDDTDAEQNLPASDWFATNDYPLAVFEMTKVSHTEGNKYEGTGTLTLRGKSVEVLLTFEANFYDDNSTQPPTHFARVEAQTTLKRLAFGVGQGDWAKTDAVADDVKVTVRIEAKQVP